MGRSGDDDGPGRGPVPRVPRVRPSAAAGAGDRHVHRLLGDLDGMRRFHPAGASSHATSTPRRHAIGPPPRRRRPAVADRIEYRLRSALDTIATLDGPFDLVFIDADKTNYPNYYEAVLPKLAPGGIIAVDNTLWSGRVLDDSDRSDDTAAIRAVNDHVAQTIRVSSACS